MCLAPSEAKALPCSSRQVVGPAGVVAAGVDRRAPGWLPCWCLHWAFVWEPSGCRLQWSASPTCEEVRKRFPGVRCAPEVYCLDDGGEMGSPEDGRARLLERRPMPVLPI